MHSLQLFGDLVFVLFLDVATAALLNFWIDDGCFWLLFYHSRGPFVPMVIVKRGIVLRRKILRLPMIVAISWPSPDGPPQYLEHQHRCREVETVLIME
jgi:hypothetical protein